MSFNRKGEFSIHEDFKHSNCMLWLFQKKINKAYCSYLRRFSKNRRALLKTCKKGRDIHSWRKQFKTNTRIHH